MTDAELDSLMKTALSDAIALDMNSSLGPDKEFQPSRNHSKQMRMMLEDPLHWVKKRERGLLQKAAGWVAILLLIISLTLGAVMLFSPTARAAVERWIVEWYETHIIIRYFGRTDGLPRYELTELPVGFTEIMRNEETACVDMLYGDENGGRIVFCYQLIQQGGATVIIPNEDVASDVMIGRNKGVLLIPQDPGRVMTLTWIDERENVQFTIMADMDERSLIRLAENLRRIK